MFSLESLFAKPSLPIECKCGDTHKGTCDQPGLQNHRHFPPFAYLPEENDIDASYYAPDEGGFMYSPTRHWALAGEIVDVTFFIRPRVTIKTKFGEKVLVNFHLDAPSPSFFNWADLKLKSSLIILYAVNRTFVDMNSGVRQESPRTVLVFPAPLEALIDEYNALAAFEQTHRKICFQCGAPETDEHKLLKCTRCQRSFYCGRGCQLPHWKVSHKNLCKHAPMLAKLASLDFNDFEAFVDWSFPTVAPTSAEERKEKANKARAQTLYRMGAFVESMPKRLEQMLTVVEKKHLASDTITKGFFEGNMMFTVDDVPTSVRETFLFQSFQEFLHALSKDSDLRQYAVDLTAGGAGFGDQNMAHTKSDMILSALSFAFPWWQHEECVGGISWSFESHWPVTRSKKMYEDSSMWDITTSDSDAFLAKNRVSDTCAFISDDLRVVAEIGESIASANPRNMVVRVLRATANESWEDSIRGIATKSSSPPNLFTLWIREDVAMCGRFNQKNPDLSLVDQLLDSRPFSLINSLLEGMGVPAENIFQRDPSDDEMEADSQICSQCGRRKERGEFSKTQLRKYHREARCKQCITNST